MKETKKPSGPQIWSEDKWKFKSIDLATRQYDGLCNRFPQFSINPNFTSTETDHDSHWLTFDQPIWGSLDHRTGPPLHQTIYDNGTPIKIGKPTSLC